MNNRGFTLIELIVVIVILGILAVTAVPKFLNLKADAQTSTLHGVQAGMQSASALVYAKAIVKGNHKEPFGLSNTVNIGDSINGGEFLIAYGYPIGVASQFERVLPLEVDGTYKYLALGASIDTLIVYFATGVTPTSITDDCIVVYLIPTSPDEKPSITVNDCI